MSINQEFLDYAKLTYKLKYNPNFSARCTATRNHVPSQIPPLISWALEGYHGFMRLGWVFLPCIRLLVLPHSHFKI